MKKYLILALVMVGIVGAVDMGLFLLKRAEIKSRYTSPREGYNISTSETITAIIPAEALKPDISLGELAGCGVTDEELKELGIIAEGVGWDAEVRDSMQHESITRETNPSSNEDERR